MSKITDEIRAKASEMYRGDEIGQEKSKCLLNDMNLPNGLLPLQDIIEVGYIKDTGFVWLIQKKKRQHKFEEISRLVEYGTEVTAFVELGKIKKLTGVKAKELLIWVTICDIYTDCPNEVPTGKNKITFKSTTGLSRVFPVSAFIVDVPVKEIKAEEEKKEGEVKEEKKEEEVVKEEKKEEAIVAAPVEIKETA